MHYGQISGKIRKCQVPLSKTFTGCGKRARVGRISAEHFGAFSSNGEGAHNTSTTPKSLPTLVPDENSSTLMTNIFEDLSDGFLTLQATHSEPSAMTYIQVDTRIKLNLSVSENKFGATKIF